MRQHLCVGPAISVSDRLPPEPLLTLRASVTHRERKHRVSRLAKQDLIEEAVHDGVATIGEVVDLEAQVSPGRQIIARPSYPSRCSTKGSLLHADRGSFLDAD